MTLLIGIASYNNPGKLDNTLALLRQNTTGDYKILIIENLSPDPGVEVVINKHVSEDPVHVETHYMKENLGYVGAVNYLLEQSTDEPYVVYCDNDAYVRTLGWNVQLAQVLNDHPEVAMTFPGGRGAYVMSRDGWNECLWSVGCFWMLRKKAQQEIGLFDDTLGHQEEVDYQTRLRLKAWRMAVVNIVTVDHDAASSNNPAAEERITKGVINWVNKWTSYFCGMDVNYHSANVMRFEDWPPNALYLEEYWKTLLPNLNDNPEQVMIEGRHYDLIKVPRYAWNGLRLYQGRII